MHRKKKFIFCSIVLLLCLGIFCIAQAQSVDEVQKLTNPLGTTDIRVLAGQVISTALGILGSVALVAFIVGGLLWLTSAGNQERIKKGSQTMLWAGAGIVLILGSYAILNTVIKGLGATGDLGPLSANYFKVQGTVEISGGKTILPMYESPSNTAKKVSIIPEGTDCIKGTGSVQGLWTQVEYNEQKGWVQTQYLFPTESKCTGTVTKETETKPFAGTICEGKECWYKSRSSVSYFYQDTSNNRFPAPDNKYAGGENVCFVVTQTKGNYIKLELKYKNQDTWFKIKSSTGATYYKKASDPKDCSAGFLEKL